MIITHPLFVFFTVAAIAGTVYCYNRVVPLLKDYYAEQSKITAQKKVQAKRIVEIHTNVRGWYFLFWFCFSVTIVCVAYIIKNGINVFFN